MAVVLPFELILEIVKMACFDDKSLCELASSSTYLESIVLGKQSFTIQNPLLSACS